MQIKQQTIDEIISRADIVEIIGKYLKLKRSGQNYFACCPFHNEKSPSFSVNLVKQFFHCFGCGESGNVITFLMKHHGLSFIDAVKSLANTYGVTIAEDKQYQQQDPEEISKRKQHKLSLNDTINKVVQYYQNSLANSTLAHKYLDNRGLTDNTIKQFQLGYAPNQISALANLFSDYATNQLLLDTGLVIKNDHGKIFDRFRDRIMFPIKNIQGQIIAFGGRIIAHGEPKYLNSPETTLFSKSQELYALFEAARQIHSQNQAIVVEGYMDALSMHKFGFTNTVASMGTAITDEQIKKLFRLCDEITFCFDGDNAGIKAAWRALEHSMSQVTDSKAVRFIFLPQDDDPDSFLTKHGSDGFITYAKRHTLTLSNFLLEQLLTTVNLDTDEGKAKLITLAKPYIEQLNAAALQVMLKQQLAKLVELDPTVLESILNNRSRYAFYVRSNQPNLAKAANKIPMLNNIKLIVHSSLQHATWLSNYKFPEQIDHYRREIQELIILLDFISNNCDSATDIKSALLKENFNFTMLNLAKILAEADTLSLSEMEFKEMLDRVLCITTSKAIKIPKIKLARD